MATPSSASPKARPATPGRGQGGDRCPLAGGRGRRRQHLGPGGGLGSAQAATDRERKESWAVLRRLPYWQQLMAEYEARGEWLRPYSLRDTFSVRAHGIVKDDTLIAAAMGHTVEMHHRSYRTSEWSGVRQPSHKRADEKPPAARAAAGLEHVRAQLMLFTKSC